MAISGLPSSASGSDNGDDEFMEAPIVAEINVTPLVDIFLLLLVIFMVTSSAIQQSQMAVQLPQSKTAEGGAAQSLPVVITVNDKGQLLLNGQAVLMENLAQQISLLLKSNKDATVVVEGDRKAYLGIIVQIMDEAKKAGAQRFAFATAQEK